MKIYTNYYHPEEEKMIKAYGNNYKEVDQEDLVSVTPIILTTENTLFHITNNLDSEPIETVICSCGSKEFNIGIDRFYTASKCVNCGEEMCIHEG